MKTEPNFVDKLCVEITFSGKSVVKLKPETKLCVKIYFVWQFELCRKLCVEFFKFRKYYAAHNSGLKIWLVSGIFWNGAVAQFKVLFIFVKAWCWFFATFLSRETLHTIYFPNCRRTLRSYFFARKLMKFINEKSCVIMENWNQTLWKTFKDNSQPKKFRKTETKLCGNLQRQFSDFSNLKTIFSTKLCG